MLPPPIKYKLNASLLAIGASYGNLEASIANVMPRDSRLRSVILLDSNYNLYELRDGEFIYAKKLFDYEPQHQFSKACALSMNGYIAIGEPRSPNCHILHIYNGVLTPIKTLVWHRNDIYNIRFSKNGRYMVSGGEDGKVFIFTMPNFNIANILPPRPDYISNIHLGKRQTLVVYSSYDNTNCVFDMGINKIIGEFETNAVAEDMTFFDDDSKIFFVCSNGESGIYDIANKTLDIKANYESWLTRVGMTKDDNFAYIGTREKFLNYLDLEKNKHAFNVELDNDGIASMRVIDAKLYLGFASGYLEIFDLKRFEPEFNDAVAKGDLKKACEIAESHNISFKSFKSYIALKDKLWAEAFKKAQDSLGDNPSQENFAKIIADLRIFFEDSEKKEAFDEFSRNIGAAKELRDAINDKDYALCYQIINENTYLKETYEFERLENLYDEAFEVAKELLLRNSTEDLNKATEILKPWQAVPSKKETINILLRNAAKFQEADRLFKAKQFGDFFKLSESFRAIKTTTNYKKALVFGEQILATINELEAKNANEKALELLEILLKFVPFQAVALNRKNTILLKLEFIQLYSQKDFTKIYTQIQKYDSLKGTAEYINLTKHFSDIFERALGFASEGNGEAVYREVEKYLNIAFFKEKIESIFNISYINEIDLALETTQSAQKDDSGDSDKSAESSKGGESKDNPPKKDESKTIDWYGTLEQYVEMFGKNDELTKIIAPHKKILEIYNKISVENKKEVAFLKTIMIYVS